MNRLVAFTLLLFTVAFPACSEKAQKGSQEKDTQELLDKLSPAEVQALARIAEKEKTLAPVSFRTKKGSQLAAGICYQYQERAYITFLAPNASSLRSVHVYLPKDNPEYNSWRLCSVITHNPDNSLCIAELPSPLNIELDDLSEISATPKSLTSIYTATWGAQLPRSKEDIQKQQEQETQHLEYLNKFDKLKSQSLKIERELRSLRNRRPRDLRESAREEHRQLGEKRLRLQNEIKELQSTARNEGYYYDTRIRIPLREARIVKKDISATQISSSTYNLQKPIDSSHASVILGSSLAHQIAPTDSGSNHILMSVNLSNIGTFHEFGFSKLSSYFHVHQSNYGKLHLKVIPSNPYLKNIEVKFFVSEQGTLPEDLEQSKHNSSLRFNSNEQCYTGSFNLSRILEEKQQANFDGVLAVTAKDSKTWEIQAPLSFSLTKKDRILIPAIIDGEKWTWEADQNQGFRKDYPEIASTKVLNSYQGSSDIQQAKLAGAGKYLIIQDDSHLRLIETSTMKALAEMPWTENYHAFAANTKNLYLATTEGFQLYKLPQLSLVKEIKFPHQSQPLSLATGSHTSSAPLLCVYASKAQLIEPQSLMPLNVKIQASKSSRGSNPLSEYNFSSRSRNRIITKAFIHSSPQGDSHIVSLLYRNGQNYQSTNHAFYQDDTNWTQVSSVKGFPSIDHEVHYKDSASSTRPPYRTTSKNTKPRSSFSYPILGRGYISLHLPQQHTVPMHPIMMTYYPVSGATEPFRFLGAHSASFVIFSETNSSKEIHPIQRIYISPHDKTLISIGQQSITLEQLPSQKINSPAAKAVVTSPPVAQRGKDWSFPIRNWNNDFDTVQLIKSPEGAKLSQDHVIDWSVPEDYVDNEASFTISTGTTSPVETTFNIKVTGKPVAIFTYPGGAQKKLGIVQTTTFSFPQKINEILPIPSQNKALIISDNSHRISLVNLKTAQLDANYRSSTGRIEATLGRDAVYLWHLNGNLIEKCDLKNLESQKISPTGLGSPLRAFVGGDVPTAILEGDKRALILYEVNPNTLQLSSQFTFPKFTTSMFSNGETQHTNRLAQSQDGTSFFIHNTLIRKQESLHYTSKRLNELSSLAARAPLFIHKDSNSVIVADKVYDLASLGSWSSKINSSEQGFTPDTSGKYLIHTLKNKQDNEFYLKLIDFSSRQSLGTITNFPEFKGSVLFHHNRKHFRHRILFTPEAETLLTVSGDNQQVILRKFPRTIFEKE